MSEDGAVAQAAAVAGEPNPAEVEAVQQPETQEVLGDEKDYLYANKYKSVDDLEKGYLEAQKLIADKRPGAPEEYEINLAEEIQLPEGYDLKDDELLNDFLPVFKELDLPQEKVDAIVNKFLAHQLEGQVDPGEELKKLGHDAQNRLADVEKFLDKTFSEEEIGMMHDLTTTAEGIQLIEKIKGLGAEMPIPAEQAHRPRESYQQLIAEASELKNKADLDIDMKSRAIYEDLMDRAAKIQIAQQKGRM